MKHVLLLRFITACCLLIGGSVRMAGAQNNADQYTVTHRVELNLLGDKKNFLFQSDWMEGRFNNRLQRFEFRMPLQYVKAVSTSGDLSVFNAVFMDNPNRVADADDIMLLWVYMPDGTRNFEAFRNPVTLTLAADCIINGKTYRTPVAMNLFFSGNLLKYGLDLTMDTIFETVASNRSFKGGPLRKFQLLVRESEMKVAFEQ